MTTPLFTQADADKVHRLVTAMAVDPPSRPLTGTDRLIDGLGFDSVRLLELTMALERAFALPAQRPEQLVAVATVDDVVGLVRRALAGDR